MAAGDQFREAVATLYRLPMEDFIPRRAALVAQARKAGDRAGAAEIGKLKKPTRSAWLVNNLVHTDPAVVGRLSDLATRLRAAERTLDGAQMRALTGEKNRLLDELTRQACSAADQARPGAGAAEEVSSTLAAALADPQVAQSLAEGALLKPASWSGFGVGAPELTLVASPVLAPASGKPVAERAGSAAKARAAAAQAAEARAAAAQAAEAEAAEAQAAEQRRTQQRSILAAAERTLSQADQEVRDAEAAHRSAKEAVTRLAGQLQKARDDVAAATLNLRQVRSERQSARRELRKLQT